MAAKHQQVGAPELVCCRRSIVSHKVALVTS